MQHNSKLPNVGTTIFTVMSALAREQGAINLSQGFPDFDCSPVLRELAHRYILDGFNQYAPMPGALPLRERIAEMSLNCYGATVHPDQEITITAGATQAIYTAIATFIHAGDEVIVFEPAYDCYVPAIEVHGGIPVYSQLNPNDFSVNWDDVKSKLNRKTKAIMINSPHNPSGTVLKKADMIELEKMVTEHDLLLISDEVYEHMVFDGQQHESVLRYPVLRKNSVVVSSFGKTVHATGWKIGYVIAPSYLTVEFRKVHQFLVFVVNHPLQLALADFLSDKKVYGELKNFYQEKRDRFLRLTATSRLKPRSSAGTYFQLMDYSAVSQEREADFAVRLTKEMKLAAIPMSAFYHEPTENKLLRFCFAKKDETLEKAAEIINRL